MAESAFLPAAFLKWAGGKRQLLPQLRRFYPARFRTYFEPFVGSGAVFFDLYGRGHLAGRRAVLSDSNPDLVGCYVTVRDRSEEVIRRLRRFAAAHRSDPVRHYYGIRDKRFNPARQRIVAGQQPDTGGYTAALAAMLIYLNRTCYNGLFRVNSTGWFNVPPGRYKNPRICDAANLRRVAAVLSSPGIEIRLGAFDAVLDEAQKGDFLYFDPPYAPLSSTASFTAYTPSGFSLGDQTRLQQVLIELARRGCLVLLSNSTAPAIARLYEGHADARAVGLRVYTVPARRAISSKAGRRGAILECIVTNIPPADTPA